MDDMVKDPVCGMEVNPLTAEYSIDYEGKTYYFCSADCLETFEDNPTEYIEEEQKQNPMS